MKRKDTLKITFAGMMFALMVVLIMLGYWFGPLAAFTLAHIPLIIGIIVIDDWRYATALGFLFGLSSLIRAAVAPLSPLDPLFVNPVLSILPRILTGIVGHFAYQLTKLIKFKKVQYALTAVATTLANTVFVMFTLMVIFNAALTPILENVGFTAGALLIAVVTFNVPIELGIAVVASIVINKRLAEYVHRAEFNEENSIPSVE